MNENTGKHLNRQAVIRWQMGDASESERNHIAGCAACQAEVKPLKDSLLWFGAAARNWGEQKAELSREWGNVRAARVRSAAAISWRVLVGACAAATVAILLIFGIGLPHWKSQTAPPTAHVQPQQIEQPQQQEEIASDNALLDAVDQDVSQEVPTAMQPLTWAANGNSTLESSAKRQ